MRGHKASETSRITRDQEETFSLFKPSDSLFSPLPPPPPLRLLLFRLLLPLCPLHWFSLSFPLLLFFFLSSAVWVHSRQTTNGNQQTDSQWERERERDRERERRLFSICLAVVRPPSSLSLTGSEPSPTHTHTHTHTQGKVFWVFHSFCVCIWCVFVCFAVKLIK